MQTTLDMNISVLHHKVYKLMAMCEDAISEAIKSFKKDDVDRANLLIENDKLINDQRDVIRNEGIELLLLKAPVASDLRAVYAISNIANELERIGDYASNIAHYSKKIENKQDIREINEIYTMTEVCIIMLNKSKRSLETRNSKLAYKIAEQDNTLDSLYSSVQETLIRKAYRDELELDSVIKALFICRALERIGDHITNICENIIYLIDGEIVEMNV